MSNGADWQSYTMENGVPVLAQTEYGGGDDSFPSRGYNFAWSSPLSLCWKWKVLVSGSDAPTGLRKATWCLLPVAYVAGMVGHMVALPFRISMVVVDALKLIWAIATLPCRENRWRHLGVRSALFGASVLEVFTCVIGIICPVIAYKLEYCIQNISIIRNHRIPWLASDFVQWVDGSAPTPAASERIIDQNQKIIDGMTRAKAFLEPFMDSDDFSPEAFKLVYDVTVFCCLLDQSKASHQQLADLCKMDLQEILQARGQLSQFLHLFDLENPPLNLCFNIISEFVRNPNPSLPLLDNDGCQIKDENGEIRMNPESINLPRVRKDKAIEKDDEGNEIPPQPMESPFTKKQQASFEELRCSIQQISGALFYSRVAQTTIYAEVYKPSS